jgi:CHAD domain-containing protein
MLPHARKSFGTLRKAARVAARDDAEATDVHEMRIRAKRFRYAVDALAEVEPAAKEHAGALSGLQDVLGDFNDAVVAEAWLREVAADEKDGQRLFVLGQLVMSQRDEIERGTREWEKAWRPVRRRKQRSWLSK